MAPAIPATRILAFDFTKGVLVLVMVIYHWLNYFYSPYGSFYRYLRFLTPSFIFITGYLISQVSLSRYGSHDLKLPKRLLGRGLKLLLVFGALNLAIELLVRRSQIGAFHFDGVSLGRIFQVYVIGDILTADGKAAAFYILLPIAYLLFLSALLIRLSQVYKPILKVAFIGGLLSVAILKGAGYESGNLELLTIGLLGLICGEMPIATINASGRHPVLLLLALGAYVLALTIWDATFTLQLVGVCVMVLTIYTVGNNLPLENPFWSKTVMLGQYSLLGYIVQIAILQGLRRGFKQFDTTTITLTASFIAAVILTYAAVEAVHRAKQSNPYAKRLYAAIFS